MQLGVKGLRNEIKAEYNAAAKKLASLGVGINQCRDFWRLLGLGVDTREIINSLAVAVAV